MKQRIVSMLVLLLLTAGYAYAQTTTVSGKVVDDTGEPVIGAAILVVGTTTGTVSDANGHFTLASVPSTAKELRVSYVGMKTAVVRIKANVRVVLRTDEKVLDELVVTALGISKQAKTLGYSATTVKADKITEGRTPSVTEALAGKVAGLQVSTTSSDPGSAGNVIVRGYSSLTGNNEPLWVVDGVPVQNNSITTATSSHFATSVDKTYEGNNLGSGVANINNDDIESVTVLKGAAATALYGSRAANGVILVTTKSGKMADGKSFGAEFNSGVMFSRAGYIPKMQNVYGQGWNGNRTLDENGSWGPEMDGTNRLYGAIYNNAQLLQQYTAVKNNVRDFFDTGVQYSNSLNINGGTDKTKYYVSYSNIYNDGIIPTSKDKYVRNTLSFNGSHRPNKYVAVSSNVNIAISTTDDSPTDQGITMIDGLYEVPRNINIVSMKDLKNPFYTPDAYFTEYGITNPYWALANNYDHASQKKAYGKVQADIYPIEKLKLTYRFGFDYNDYDYKNGTPKITADNPSTSGNNKQDGSVTTKYYRSYELNHDVMANYANVWGDWDLNATAGWNVNERYLTQNVSEGTDLTVPVGWWDLANCASTSTTERQRKRRLIGLYADATLGWREMLYLGLTGRNDWSSTLPKDGNSFFYGGSTLSWIFSKLIKTNNILSFGKMRLAYGKTGNDADPYFTYDTYTQGSVNLIYDQGVTFPMTNGINGFMTNNTMAANTLKPEMTTEWELGTNLQFFNGRIGFDAAFYNRVTNDQIMQLSVDPASGYRFKYSNFGSIRNRGVELLLTLTPVKTRAWQWDISANFAKNWNKVLELAPELGGKYDINQFSTSNEAIFMYAIEGKELGQLWGYMPKTDGAGHIVVDVDGQPVIDKENVQPLGKSTQNKYTAGFSSSLRFKDFSLSATVDMPGAAICSRAPKT